MTKFIAISLLCVFAFNFLPSIRAADFLGGAVGDFATASIQNVYFDNFLKKPLNVIRRDVCLLLGPDFLEYFPRLNNCSTGVQPPKSFESYECFCKWLIDGGPELQACVSYGLKDGEYELKGIIDIRGHIIQCCDIPPMYTSSIGGQVLYDYAGGEILDKGLVGHALFGAAKVVNDLFCKIFGSNFPNNVYQDNDCPEGSVPQTACRSIDSFCDFFHNSSPTIQKCLTDTIVQINFGTKGIARFGKGRVDLGKCCAGTSGKKPENPPSACKSPETTTKCND